MGYRSNPEPGISGTAPTCLKCRRVIPPEDVNVAADVAYCRNCNLANRLSDLVGEPELQVDTSTPPPGAWERQQGLTRTIGAIHRSFGTAMGTLLVALFWNGITSIFVLIALASTLRHLGFHLPDWFPAPTSEGESMSRGMTIFLWLFLTPFIAIGMGMIAAFFSALAGRTEVRLEGNRGEVFRGIGFLGWRKRFETAEVTHVRIAEQGGGDGKPQTFIVLEFRSGKKIRFGSLLNEERRSFIAAATRRAVLR